MHTASATIESASYRMKDALADAQRSWRDATAVHYDRRYHRVITDALDRYAAALERLDEAIARAEAIARDD